MLDPTVYPPGTMYGNHSPGSGIRRRTFAVAGPDRGYRCGDGEPEFEWLEDLPPNTCGLIAGGPHLGPNFARLSPDNPSLHRMADALRGAGITPRVWTGTEAVPFDAWLETARGPQAVDLETDGDPGVPAGGTDPGPVVPQPPRNCGPLWLHEPERGDDSPARVGEQGLAGGHPGPESPELPADWGTDRD